MGATGSKRGVRLAHGSGRNGLSLPTNIITLKRFRSRVSAGLVCLVRLAAGLGVTGSMRALHISHDMARQSPVAYNRKVSEEYLAKLPARTQAGHTPISAAFALVRVYK